MSKKELLRNVGTDVMAVLGLSPESGFHPMEYLLHELGHVVTLPHGCPAARHSHHLQDFIYKHIGNNGNYYWCDRRELEALAIEWMLVRRLGLQALTKDLQDFKSLLALGNFRACRSFERRLKAAQAYMRTGAAKYRCGRALEALARGLRDIGSPLGPKDIKSL